MKSSSVGSFLTDANIEAFTLSVLEKRWLASTYLDNGQWGILTEDNEIVVGLSSRLTESLARHIADAHNAGIVAPQMPHQPRHGARRGGV